MPAVPERIAWAVGLLGETPGDRLLELGCGPGAAMALCCERHATLHVTGIDRSAAAIARARARLAPWAAEGRATLVRGAFEAVTPRGRFPRALAINVNLFWTNPAVAFAAARRLLEPGGTLVLAYEPPDAARLRTLERTLGAHAAANRWEPLARHAARFRATAGVALVVRPLGE